MIVERRLLRDRRRGLDRRIVDRRLQALPVANDRRSPHDRRSLRERRNAVPRRSWIDRRGQGGLTLTTP